MDPHPVTLRPPALLSQRRFSPSSALWHDQGDKEARREDKRGRGTLMERVWGETQPSARAGGKEQVKLVKQVQRRGETAVGKVAKGVRHLARSMRDTRSACCGARRGKSGTVWIGELKLVTFTSLGLSHAWQGQVWCYPETELSSAGGQQVTVPRPAGRRLDLDLLGHLRDLFVLRCQERPMSPHLASAPTGHPYHLCLPQERAPPGCAAPLWEETRPGEGKRTQKGHPKSGSLPCYAQVSQEQGSGVLTHLAGSTQLSNKKQRPPHTSGEKQIKHAGTKAPTPHCRSDREPTQPNPTPVRDRQREPHLAWSEGKLHLCACTHSTGLLG